MLEEGLIPIYGEEEHMEIRYLKMFRTFDDCIFCKNFSYQFYKDNVKDFLDHVQTDRAKSINNIRDKVRSCKTELGKFKAVLPKGSPEYDQIATYEKWLTTAFLNCMKLAKSTPGFEGLNISIDKNDSCPLPILNLKKTA
jgi:hypothetical protein